MAKQKNKTMGFSGLLLRAGVLLLGGYLVVSMVLNQVEIRTKRQQLQTVEQQLETQQAQNEELQRILESGSDQELIEQVARDKLGYAKPNERVFVDATGK